MVLLNSKAAQHNLGKVLHPFGVLFVVFVGDENVLLARVSHFVVKEFVLVEVGDVDLSFIAQIKREL